MINEKKQDARNKMLAYIEQLYRDNNYLDAYRLHTDFRVGLGSRAAIGGMWERIGEVQFEFLIAQGLKPHHTLLDIGCGTLRGGRHFIAYLEAKKYTGIDLSEKTIESAHELIAREHLSDKNPELSINPTGSLKFEQFTDTQFDYILAQSVFTHLMPQHIEECFQHIHTIMGPQSKFYFTYNREDKHRRVGLKNFKYPLSYFEELAKQYHYTVRDLTDQYHHPRPASMLELMKQAD